MPPTIEILSVDSTPPLEVPHEDPTTEACIELVEVIVGIWRLTAIVILKLKSSQDDSITNPRLADKGEGHFADSGGRGRDAL